MVAFTGAGISTACGIPDFRGPDGVWTCQRAQRPPPRLSTSFVAAKPSLTHQARSDDSVLLRAIRLTSPMTSTERHVVTSSPMLLPATALSATALSLTGSGC